MDGETDECLLFLAWQWNVPWLLACLPGCPAGWLPVYLWHWDDVASTHKLTLTHTEEVVLRHAAHTVALALGKLWQQAQPGSPSQPVSQACCLLLRLLLLLPPPLVGIVFLACRLPSAAAATLRISNAQPMALFVALFGTA